MKISEELSNRKNVVLNAKKAVKQWKGPDTTAKGQKEAILVE
jgi:hypothetical protein